MLANLNNLSHFKDSPALSRANSAINLSGAQDLTRNKNVVKPLPLSLQVVGKTFAAGDVFLPYYFFFFGKSQMTSVNFN